jgi:hypothetical protein
VSTDLRLSTHLEKRTQEFSHTHRTSWHYFGSRGSSEFEDSHVFDLSARYSMAAWKSVEPWIRLEVRNLFNDDSITAWNTFVRPDADGPVDENGIWTDYVRGPGFGQARSPDDFVTPREFFVSLGMRF